MLQFGRVDEVNINGTCHVLDACLDLAVKRLVYCSTYNVAFGGQQIINGNETMPYFPIDRHVDPYGRSKSIAEQLVLKNNARPLKYSYITHLPFTFYLISLLLPILCSASAGIYQPS